MKGVVASGALALLAACGGTPTATPAASTAPSTGGAASAAPASVAPPSAAAASTGVSAAPGSLTTVTWFSQRDTSGFRPTFVEAINKTSTTFKIDYQEQGATTQDLHDKFVTVAQGKDPSADLVSMDVPYVPEFAAAGWTIPMDTALSKDELAKFFKGTLDGATYDKKLYAIPWYNNGPGLWVRKDLLAAKGLAIPKTYDELQKAALAVQTPEMSGFAMQLAQGEAGIINWMEYLWGYGGSLVDENLKVVVDQGTAGVEGMQKIVDFVYKDKIIPEAALQFKLGADVVNLFRTGKTAMIRLWFGNAGELYKPDTTITPEQWEIVPLPAKDNTKAGPGCLGTWNLGVAVASKKQQAAIEAIKAITSQENQKAHMLGNGSLASRVVVFEDADIIKKYPYAKSAQASFETLRPRPVTPFYPEISASALQPAFGQAIARQITPDQMVKQIAEKMRTILK
jgi:multiple sugar transport system substrate-binding protein